MACVADGRRGEWSRLRCGVDMICEHVESGLDSTQGLVNQQNISTASIIDDLVLL